jgi:GGDEF domain-containing protein
VDAVTGLYSTRGLARRAHEIGSQASREGSSLACIVVSAEANGGDGGGVERVVRALADMFRHAARASDAVGRIGEAEFAIFAPGADQEGAARLAQRFVVAAQQLDDHSSARVVSGYHAVPDFRQSGLQPDDLLARATAAHRAARHQPLEQALH